MEPGINRDREFGGLMEAMKEFDLQEGIILTQYQEDVVNKDNFVIKIVPVWKWLLNYDL